MNYYKKIDEKIVEYSFRHENQPKLAMLKMIAWNFILLLDGIKKETNSQLTSANVGNNNTINTNGLLVYMDNMNYIYKEQLRNEIDIFQQEISNIKSATRKEKTIHVTFITDNKYAYPTSVAITSIYYNGNPNNDYFIHVVGVDLNDEMRNLIISSGLHVEVIDMSSDEIDIRHKHEHVSTAALFKFMLPYIFETLEKILYMDSDMLALGDISELYDISLGENYAGVVRDYHIMEKGYRALKKRPIADYFNTGMMLLNLKKLRSDKVPEKLLAKKQELLPDSDWSFMDQDAFNIIFENNKKLLSVKYNFLSCYYIETERYELYKLTGQSFDDICKAFDSPTILHIGGSNKPWNSVLGEKRFLYEKYRMISELFRGGRK